MFERFVKNKCILLVLMFMVVHMAAGPGFYNAHAVEKAKGELEKYSFAGADVSTKRSNDQIYSKSKNVKSSSELLEEKIKELYNILESKSQSYSTRSLDNNEKSLDRLTDEIKELDKKITQEFKQTKKSLKDKNLSNKMLERHQQFVEEYFENMKRLLELLQPEENIAGVNRIADNSTDKPDKKEQLKEIIKKKWLNEELKESNDDLPKKKENFNPGKPRKETSIKPAYEYSTDTQSIRALSVSSNYQSTSLDLQETKEIKITPEIKELARNFNNNPVKIYEYVKNNFDYEPYYGSVRGAQETLQQKAGNDFDQASLLIALYRASGIPARYVYGVVRVPIEKVEKWLSIEDAKTAVSTLASNGIPSTAIVTGNEIAYVEMEHVWVEAKVPVTNYRGTSADDSGKAWVPLDPGFKEYQRIEGIDLQEKVSFNVDDLIQELENSADITAGGSAVTNLDQELLKQKFEQSQ